MLKGNRFLRPRPSSGSERVTFAFGEFGGRTLLYLRSVEFRRRTKKKKKAKITIAVPYRHNDSTLSEIRRADFGAAAVVALWWITRLPRCMLGNASASWCFALVSCWWRLLLSRPFGSSTDCFFMFLCRAGRVSPTSASCRRRRRVAWKLWFENWWHFFCVFFFYGGSFVHCGQTTSSDFRT